MSDHWNYYSAFWNRLGPPLRPPAETAAIYRKAIAARDGRVMLYGVTPELAGIGRQQVAVDGSEGMVRNTWPGDTASRRAILGNWLALPFADGAMSAAIGDGILSNIAWPDETAGLLDELVRVLAPGGRAVFRTFCTPGRTETLAQVRDAAFDGEIESFHALKWRVAMARMPDRRTPNIAVRDILARFDETFPDRTTLARATGWHAESIATIDAYAGSPHLYSFPSLPQLLALAVPRFGSVATLDSGRYPLCERCPLIVLDRGPADGRPDLP